MVTTRPLSQRWCHRRAVYHDPSLARHGGPLLSPSTDPAVAGFWAAVTVAVLLAASSGTLVLAGGFGLLSLPGAAGAAVTLTFVLTFALVPPGLAALYLGPLRRRLARRALRARCRMCVRCGHDLSGRPPGSDRCPECGIVIRTRDAVIFWCRYLAA